MVEGGISKNENATNKSYWMFGLSIGAFSLDTDLLLFIRMSTDST